jgi:hypothetical protein
MLKKLQRIRKTKGLVQYRFDLRELNVPNDFYCGKCSFYPMCQNELILSKFITLNDLCRQLYTGKQKLIYASKKGLESIEKFCR